MEEEFKELLSLVKSYSRSQENPASTGGDELSSDMSSSFRGNPALSARGGRHNDKSEDLELIKKAWEFAKISHLDQKGVSGDPFVKHPLETAKILASWRMDTTSIVVGLLHDTIEWGIAKRQDLSKTFGEEVARLVELVSKVSYAKLGLTRKEWIIENLRKMILAMAEDLRVVIIRMAERLDNLKSLYVLPDERQDRIARESLEIFAPLAERLGMRQIKGELEDLAFPYVYPETFEKVKKESRPFYKKAQDQLEKIKRTILKKLAIEGIKPEILGREKPLYSLWKKLERKEIGWDFEKIHDFVALRILVNTISECYLALGVVHKLFRPVPQIKTSDFIARPKPNGYQSIHTKVFGPGMRIVEIQIRTHEMDRQAEFGLAGHWAYSQAKTQGATDATLESGKVVVPKDKLLWIRELTRWHEEISDSEEFLRAVKFDALSHRIFVFSPKGDVYDLPKGATPVDFAYAIHSGLANFIKAAKVNTKIVPLNYKLKNGQVVEIIKSKNPKAPSRDWLEFVVTTNAKRQLKKNLN